MTLRQVPPWDGEGDRAQRGGGGRPATLRKPETYAARRARRDMSLPEILLWQRLKGSPQGIAFRKQHPIGPYRADFYRAALKLVIEVDGIAHDMGDRPQHDEQRTAILEQKGYSIIRLAAAELLRDPDAVADSIIALTRSSPFTGRGTARSVVEGGIHPHKTTDTPLHPSAAPSGSPPRERGGV